MKIQLRKSPAVSLVLALGLSTAFFAGTAHAADTAKTTPKLTGEHLTFLTGFIGATPLTAQFHLTITKNNGKAFIGTQRWRDCTDNIEKCKLEGTESTGWTKPEAVF